jgi:hypothetical protein
MTRNSTASPSTCISCATKPSLGTVLDEFASSERNLLALGSLLALVEQAKREFERGVEA